MMTLRSISIIATALISYQFAIAVSAATCAADTTASPQTGPLTVKSETAETEAEPDSLAGYDVTELDDFVIVQRKRLVESDGARLSYNVTEDPEAGSSNILDILRKVPGVTVDAEDNVKVNGQSSFKILMNGQENPMLKGDIKTVLKSIPAATIKKIEVISEPGAKYEAEGTGGILNIVTDKKTDLTGFMTQLSGWVNGYQAGGNIYACTKLHKVMLDANISYNDGKVWPRSFSRDTKRDYLDGDGAFSGSLRSKSRYKSGWDYTGTTLNMSWEPDTLNLFNISANYGYNTWGSHGQDERTLLDADLAEVWRLQRYSAEKGRYNGVGAQASYQHNFGREGHNLILSYEFDYGRQNGHSDSETESLTGDLTEDPYTGSRTRQSFASHIVQIDYSNPFSPKHLFEAGAKMNINNDRSDNKTLGGPDKENATSDGSLASAVKQYKDIYGIYASYTGTFDKWSAKAGVRYEHTRMGLDYRIGKNPDFTTRLNDVVPNAAVSYNFTGASSLRMAYQMRISRPGLWALNPWINTTTPGQLQYGNPDLKSEKSHNVTLSYSNYEGKFGGSAQLLYRYTANSINDIIFMKEGLLNSTYANIGKAHCAQLSLNGDWDITNSLRWSVYASCSYQYFKAESELLSAKNLGWQYYVNSNVNYTMPCKVRISAYGGFYTPWLDLQGKGSNGYYYGLGFSRSFLRDDALSVSLNANSFLPYKRSNKYTQNSESVRLSSYSVYKSWNVGVSVTWKFGGLKASVKKTAANIEKESEGSKGGGQGGK